MDYALIIVLVLIFAVGIPFTLWWWKLADRWADAEHKRFKPKGPATPVERVVIRNPSSGGEGERNA
ncbi:MAG: hypothetical protein IT436_02205 [Phycisphaerales bacterium]|nr:hypothetical protein [Phycisphaerales bacterium]